MMRLFLPVIVLAFPTAIANAGVIPLIPRLPAAALKPSDAPEQPAEDPTQLAERITQNTKAAADRLAQDDTSETTRKTQEQIIKDIDALLKQSQNPPPPMGGGSSQKNQNNDQSNNGKQSQNQQDGQSQGQSSGSRGGGRSPMGAGGQGGRNGGQRPQKGSWRERRNQGESGTTQQTGNTKPMKKGTGNQSPMRQANSGEPMNSAAGGAKTKATPDLPLDEAITKQVWGHLPERLRQQMSQYYRERFMPKYGDLLRQYYAALAEREKAAKQP